jgi:hypothetical protein
MARLIRLTLVSLVVAAAIILLVNSQDHPVSFWALVVSVAPIVAWFVERVAEERRWVARDSRRADEITALAHASLIRLTKNRVLCDDTLGLMIHIWEVPLWYRSVFPLWLRNWLKRLVARRHFKRYASWRIRPTLKRTAAVGIVDRPTTGVRFTKGVGLVGRCIELNSENTILRLDVTTPEYEQALKLGQEEWDDLRSKSTLPQNLHLEEASRLSETYGLVIAKALKARGSGEAIGCVTVSVGRTASQDLNVVTQPRFETELRELCSTLMLGRMCE